MGFGECCCTCLKGFCAIPVGGLIAVAGICLGGIMGLSGLDDAADRSAAPRELDLARELAVCGLDEAYESEEFDDVPGRAPIG